MSGKSHKDVVQMLRQGGDNVTLGLKNPVDEDDSPQENGRMEENIQRRSFQEEIDENTITVTVNKQSHGSLGLSLARRTGSDGNFIRMIADGSAAADEG